MKILTAILLACSISGCINRAPSLRMLDARAQYEKDSKQAALLELGVENGAIPVKSEPRVHKVWIHAFEMESGDYFWGGFMSLVTESDRWVFAHPDAEDPYAGPTLAPMKKDKTKETRKK